MQMGRCTNKKTRSHGEEEETADGESQEDEEDVEGTLQKKTSEGVLKDASNTATEVAAEMLFWSNMKICFELLPNHQILKLFLGGEQY